MLILEKREETWASFGTWKIHAVNGYMACLQVLCGDTVPYKNGYFKTGGHQVTESASCRCADLGKVGQLRLGLVCVVPFFFLVMGCMIISQFPRIHTMFQIHGVKVSKGGLTKG